MAEEIQTTEVTKSSISNQGMLSNLSEMPGDRTSLS